MNKGTLFVILLSRLITSILTNPIPEDIKPVVGSTTAIMKPASENTTHLHHYHERFLSLWATLALVVATVIGAAGFAISMSVPRLLAGHNVNRVVIGYDCGTRSSVQRLHGTATVGQRSTP